MRMVRTWLACLCLAVFAASGVVHGVAANAMALAMAEPMAQAPGEAMAMPDCEACPEGAGDAAATACEMVCATASVALPGAATPSVSVVFRAGHDRPGGATPARGLRAPPDPFPPRPFI